MPHRNWIACLSLAVVLTAMAVAGAQSPLEAPASGPASAPSQDAPAQPAADPPRASILQSHVGELYAWPMWPLWICSLALVMLIIERAVALNTGIVDPRMVREVSQQLARRRVTEAQQAAVRSSTVQGRAWADGLRDFSLGGVTLHDALTNASAIRVKPLKRNLAAIQTLSAISPLLGLLGTVIGMIIVFDQISLGVGAAGSADVKARMAEGIMIALFTTVFGLVIAIPGILFGRYFSGKVNRFAEQIEADIDRVRSEYAHAAAQAGSEPGGS
ncbi:MAG: MotA/TolQ/ExbB proton channel family protein [Phycisphaerae bacterium]|jgi:biopolymer transport protein ExbB|nr:MotA/TolQ/ExbB proton channel family protein [Phycisphaerae bacterium]